MLALICATSLVIYKLSYNVLWFKIQPLFDIVPASMNRRSTTIAKLQTKENGFLYKFYSEYSLSSKKVTSAIRVVSSTNFTCCVIAIEIILWQIKTADQEQRADLITKIIWPLISIMLSLFLILIQPFFILISLLNKFFMDKADMDKLTTVTSGTIIVWIFALHNFHWGPFYYTESLLTKLSIVGVTIMAILSGVASVSTPYYIFIFLWNKGRVDSTKSNNINTNASLIWLNDVMLREKIKDYETNIGENVMILNKIDNEPGGSDSVLREQLIEKIGWYQLELGKLENKLKDSKQVRTVKKLFQLGFLLYCIYKLISTFTIKVPHIIMHAIAYPKDYSYEYFEKLSKGNDEASSGDPLAVTLANIFDFLIFRFNYQQELDSLTKQISLILSISLFICSISTVTTTISYLLRLFPLRLQLLALSTIQSNGDEKGLPISNNDRYNTEKKPSIIKNLIVSELTGIYILATILMIRSNLPFGVSTKLNELLGEKFTVPNVVIDVWFDKVFAITCVLTLIGIKIAERTLTKMQ